MDLKKGLTVTADRGAVCGLYPDVPAKKVYAAAIYPQNALATTCVKTEGELTT